MQTKLTNLIDSTFLRYAELIREERYEEALSVAQTIEALTSSFYTARATETSIELEQKRGKLMEGDDEDWRRSL